MSSANISQGFEDRRTPAIIGIDNSIDNRIDNFRVFNFLLIFLIVSLLLTGSSSAQKSLVILNSSDPLTMSRNIEYIESLGGSMTHRFPPHILIGDIPADKINQLEGHGNIVDIITKPLDVTLVKGYGETAEIAVSVWNNNYIAESQYNNPLPVTPGPVAGDILRVPEKSKSMQALGKNTRYANEIPLQVLPYGAGFYDTSEYMIGDTAVGIIFLESNGTIDPDTENWTTDRESNVINKIAPGLNWWAAREPNARLTFTYDIHYRMPTGYEPIVHPQTDEPLWITDAMTDLGYSNPDYFYNVYDYNNAIRQSFNTDWAFTIFVADSANDTDGLFSDGYFAYAYLDGPFVVMTYDNDGYSIVYMDAVIAHETGHIFNANDQYTSAGRPCNEITGYLAIENQNSAYPHVGACDSNVASIMRSQISPYVTGSLDTYARQQVGWRDTDADGIMDIIDFDPVSILNNYSPDPTNDSTPEYSGTSSSASTYPNNNPNSLKNNITINRISNVQYRIDTGSWINASATDGSFNSSTEDFNFTPELSEGTHTIEVRALNTAGNWETSYASDNITFLPPFGYINGTVLDNGTGIMDAIVSTDTGITSNTNDNGFYSLAVPPGTYNLTAASEPGYYVNGSNVVTAIVDSTVLQDIELARKPTGTITGIVGIV